MTVSPQVVTAVERCRAENSLAALTSLWANGFKIREGDRRHIDSELRINGGRKARAAAMTNRVNEHKAMFRADYLRARTKPGGAWDEATFQRVFVDYSTLPDGKPFLENVARKIALGGGRPEINRRARKIAAKFDSP